MSDSSDEGERLLSDGRTGKDLSSFLAKVDAIGISLRSFISRGGGKILVFDVLLEVRTECFDVLFVCFFYNRR